MDFDFEYFATVTVSVKVTYEGCEAKLYGPPEECHPAEGPEFEISVFVGDTDITEDISDDDLEEIEKVATEEFFERTAAG